MGQEQVLAKSIKIAFYIKKRISLSLPKIYKRIKNFLRNFCSQTMSVLQE